MPQLKALRACAPHISTINAHCRNRAIVRIAGTYERRVNALPNKTFSSSVFNTMQIQDSMHSIQSRKSKACCQKGGYTPNEKCIPQVMDQLDRFFRRHNRLAATYTMLREIEEHAALQAIEAGEELPVVNMVFK